jgi:hypothetical protein
MKVHAFRFKKFHNMTMFEGVKFFFKKKLEEPKAELQIGIKI